MPAPEQFDFVVFGSGFGGSIMSMLLRRLGHSVLLVERGVHPRFVIGESSTPFANLLLERLAAEYDLPFLRSLAEWGSWQKHFPQIGSGLKRGFTFFHHQENRAIDFTDRCSQLLVAASPNDHVADTHWYRPDFDHFLVQQAQRLGVTYLDRTTVESCEHSAGRRFRLKTPTERRSIHARFAIDASGAKGVLAEQLNIPSTEFANYPKTHAIYAHFKNVRPLSELTTFGEVPPYPPEAAAVHHVFDNGWIWVLRFNNGITSAGAALTGPLTGDSETNWNALLHRFPSLRAQFQGASTIPSPLGGERDRVRGARACEGSVAPSGQHTFYSIPQLSFRRAKASGPDWALLPSAAGFVDPLLSTGFALNLLGISRLAHAFSEERSPDLSRYERLTFTELDAAADLIGALYSKMNSFSEFFALTLLYFAAMSFTETAWRLDKQNLADMFLLTNDASFTKNRRELCARAHAGGSVQFPEVVKAIEPWDIAGLTDTTRRNWYPVVFNDLLRSHSKLGATHAEIDALIRKLNPAAPIARAAPALL